MVPGTCDFPPSPFLSYLKKVRGPETIKRARSPFFKKKKATELDPASGNGKYQSLFTMLPGLPLQLDLNVGISDTLMGR